MPDKKNSSHSIAALAQGGLGLPDRDYYLSEEKDRAETREKYRAHVAAMLALVGGEYADANAAAAAADDVVLIETSIAKSHLSPAERRDAEKTYNKFASCDVLPNGERFPWRAYFEALGKPEPGELNVSWPDALVAATDALIGSPGGGDSESGRQLDYKRAVLAYATFHCASSAASYLADDFVNEDFSFFGRELNGQKELKPRWKRVVSQANGAIGELVGQKYVERHFPKHAKDAAVRLVECVKGAVEDRLRELPWMSALTKEKALEKMSGFRVKIGYPDEWKDYAALELAAEAPYYSNARAAQMFEHERMLARIDAPVDRERWFMAPQQVNAYYHPMLNEIVFPAAILQPPFFDPAADPAVNFGAIGAVIGHEITHGFDDQGRKYDASGNMNDWWQPADADQFNARAAVIVKQANDTVVHTQDEECEERKAGPFSLSKFGVRSVLAKDCTCRNVNGELTQGENIADLGGLRLAYRAWGEYVKTNGADGQLPDNVPDNFPKDSAKRFFFSWATIWRQNITAKLAAKYIAVDPHAPPEVRVNGTVSNMPEFIASFDVKEGDGLFRTDETRVDIW